MLPVYLVNGITTEFIDVADRGLNYGDGIFETLLYSDGKCQFWDQHIARMQTGAEKLGIAFPGEQVFLDDVSSLIRQSRSQELAIKLILTRGSSGRGYAVKEKSLPLRIASISVYQPRIELQDGVKATICKQTVSINKGLAGYKHLNRLENVIARNEWNDEYHEGIMLDDEKNVIEGTMSNLFMIKDGVLQTPDLTRSGIAGVIRQNILAIANQEKLTVDVKQLSLGELYDADAVFLTNSMIGIWPVISIDAVNYSSGDITKALQKKLRLCSSDNAKTIK